MFDMSESSGIPDQLDISPLNETLKEFMYGAYLLSKLCVRTSAEDARIKEENEKLRAENEELRAVMAQMKTFVEGGFKVLGNEHLFMGIGSFTGVPKAEPATEASESVTEEASAAEPVVEEISEVAEVPETAEAPAEEPAVEETPEVAEAPETAETPAEEPEPAPVPEVEMPSDPNAKMSPEQIAALFAAAEAPAAEPAVEETPAAEPTVEETPAEEPEPAPAPEVEMPSDPNAKMSPEQIAALFAAAGN